MANGHGGARPGAGRPKGPVTQAAKDLQAAAQERGAAALEVLVSVMTDEDAPHSSRIAAATAVLDRGYGRPKQTNELSGPNGEVWPTSIQIEFESPE